MGTLLTLMGSSVVYVSAIHSNFFRVKIEVRVRRYVIIYKIRLFCNFAIIYCKNRDVYTSNSDGIVCGIYFCNTKYFFHGKNSGTSPPVSIYL